VRLKADDTDSLGREARLNVGVPVGKARLGLSVTVPVGDTDPVELPVGVRDWEGCTKRPLPLPTRVNVVEIARVVGPCSPAENAISLTVVELRSALAGHTLTPVRGVIRYNPTSTPQCPEPSYNFNDSFAAAKLSAAPTSPTAPKAAL